MLHDILILRKAAPRRIAALALSLVVATGCTTTSIRASEVPGLTGPTVKGIDGARRPPPGRWQAMIIPRRAEGWRLMTPEGQGTVHAWPMPEDASAEERQGWSEQPVEFTRQQARLEGGALWVTDTLGREVAVPVAWVDRVEVRDLDAEANRSLAIGLGAGLGGAAVIVIGAIVLVGGAGGPR